MAAHPPRPNIVKHSKCPFCLSPLPDLKAMRQGGDSVEVPCPCCGTYQIANTAIDVVEHWNPDPALWAAIAYQIKKMTSRSVPPRLDTYVLRTLKETARLPHPDQIVDDFVLWCGTQYRWPGDSFDVVYEKHRTLLGAPTIEAFRYMLVSIVQSSLFSGDLHHTLVDSGFSHCSLNPQGWSRFRELSASNASSRYGFMAMKYRDEQLDALVRDHLLPQVQLAGFELRRLDEGQPAGLIDDQLRLRIRQSRFLVCDLTHGNRGAYWEAGYAEGLGIPVIYSCRRDVFDDTTHPDHPHFDAAHWVTVPWDPADLAAAAVKLKTIVRATLPSEARLED